MTNDMSVEQLLVWRLAQADADAPPAPRAARLLDLIRPWWEVWPERASAPLPPVQIEITSVPPCEPEGGPDTHADIAGRAIVDDKRQ